MPRPRGEIRQALAQAADVLYAERGAVSWRDLAMKAQVGFSAAQTTVENMVRAGELAAVGYEKQEGSGVWRALYEPAHVGECEAPHDDAAAALVHVLHCWSRGGD